jgi:hypothetical protein
VAVGATDAMDALTGVSLQAKVAGMGHPSAAQ